ncbi:MAG: peptidylprolyl isomerase [Balneolaceae bacterium]
MRRAFLPGLVFIFLFTGCSKDPVFPLPMDMQQMEEVTSAIAERNVASLIPFLDHPNPVVRALAWQGAAYADVEDPDRFFERVTDDRSTEAWLALSLQPFGERYLDKLLSLWMEAGFATKAGICTVIRRHGGEPEALFLLRHEEELGREPACALAIGVLASREAFQSHHIGQLLSLAATVGNPEVRNNLIYGFYRNRVNDVRQPAFESSLDSLLTIALDEYDERLMQMHLRMSDGGSLSRIASLGDRKISSLALWIELARSIPLQEEETLRWATVQMLLQHTNPQVLSETLQALQRVESLPEEWLQFIEKTITQINRHPAVFLASLELLQSAGHDIAPYRRTIASVASRSPILAGRAYALLRHIQPREAYLTFLMHEKEQETMRGLYAVRELVREWGTGTETEQEMAKQLAVELIEAQHRSQSAAVETLLMDEAIFSDAELAALLRSLMDAEKIEHEVAAILLRVMNAREMAVQEVTEELLPLLTERGKMVVQTAAGKPVSPSFRKPDAERLAALGRMPLWRLTTTQGTVEIELYPHRTPFTVSMIDSVTRSGAYNGVYFHRVIPLFVAQGGDITLGDGSGAPPWVLPTEPIADTYESGRVGMASSGIDTEGTQFFVMTGWSPHLDGGYTQFGKVVRGMEVIERLTMVDRILRAKMVIR